MAIGSYQELHRAGIGVTDVFAQLQGQLAEPASQFGGQFYRRGLFDQLQVPALDRTISLKQVDQAAVFVGDDLDFYVGFVFEVPLKEQAGTAESAGSDLAGALDDRGTVFHGLDDVDADATAAFQCLDHQRNPQLPGPVFGLIIFHRLGGSGQYRQSRLLGQLAGAEFVAHLLHDFRSGADKADPGLLAAAGENGVLRQKTIARVHRLRAGIPGGCQDLVHV